MPSMGYVDARTKMYYVKATRYLQPWKTLDIYHKKVPSFEETKNIVFGSKWVQNEIEKLAKKKLEDGIKSKSKSQRKFSMDAET